jgi:pyroglutamyl-peptidase
MRLLLTTFGPYEAWKTNASQMAVERLELADFDAEIAVRQYPVDFDGAKAQVLADHQPSPQLMVHVGQSKRACKVELELLAVNFGRESDGAPHFALEPGGPAGLCCRVNYDRVVSQLAAEEIPVEISFHAGVFICNAVFYWSQFAAATARNPATIALVHLPLDPTQREKNDPGGSLPIEQSTRALEVVLQDLIRQQSRS